MALKDPVARKAFDRLRGAQPRRKESIKAARYWRQPHTKAKMRAVHLRRLCNITPEEWDISFDMQGRRCAACGADTPGHRWCTDHDHATGQFRGILCLQCNTSLSVLENKSRRAVLEYYLEKHK